MQKVNTYHSLMLTNKVLTSVWFCFLVIQHLHMCTELCYYFTVLCYSQNCCKNSLVLNIIRLFHLVKEYMNVLWHLQVSNYFIIAKLYLLVLAWQDHQSLVKDFNGDWFSGKLTNNKKHVCCPFIQWTLVSDILLKWLWCKLQGPQRWECDCGLVIYQP